MDIVVPCIRLALDMFIEVQIDVKIIDNPELNYITRVKSSKVFFEISSSDFPFTGCI